MIISASRRTDIPAFYSEWFINRINDGYLMTRNPMNKYQVGKINLNPELIDCIVFWSKNPANMIPKLNQLKDYNYYFQFTLNPYPRYIEKGLPPLSELIDTFKRLSDKIGSKRVIWRYDPILLTDEISVDYHRREFEKLASALQNYTSRCVISFIDMYKKCDRNLKPITIRNMTSNDMRMVGYSFSQIAKTYNIEVETCAELINLQDMGIRHGKCIDDKLIEKIIQKPLDVKKDKNQRLECGCVSSIDIGAYNTCPHHCLYCYANFNYEMVEKNRKLHDVNSPFMIGNNHEKDKVTERKMKSLVSLEKDWWD